MPPQKFTAKQHYVPQFYLRQWVDGDGGFYPAEVVRRQPPEVRIFTRKSNPSRFCYENFFYAQRTGEADEMSQQVEKAFAEIEGVFSNELPRIEKKILNNEQIDDDDKYSLAQCMTFLHLRGKKYLDESKRMTNEMAKKMMQMQLRFSDQDPKMKKLLEEHKFTKEEMIESLEGNRITVDMGNAHHLQMLKELEGFSNLLFAKFWKIFISREGHFITSDAPYIDTPLSREFYGNDFLSREQSFILSPRVMIFAQYPKNESGKKIIRKDITGQKNPIGIFNAHNLMRSIKFGFHSDPNVLQHSLLIAQALYLDHMKNRPPQQQQAQRLHSRFL